MPAGLKYIRRRKSYIFFRNVVDDMNGDGVQTQTIMKVCVHIYQRMAELGLLGNPKAVSHAWESMNQVFIDVLKVSQELADSVYEEITR
jgi:hypothetical protein